MRCSNPIGDNKRATAVRPSAAMRARLGSMLLGSLALASCVISEKPLIDGAKPVFGEGFDVVLFQDFRKAAGYTSHKVHYTWRDGVYASVAAGSGPVVTIAFEPIMTDNMIVQRSQENLPGPQSKLSGYFVARKVAEDAYLFAPIDERDMTADDRARICEKNAPEGFCPIKDHAQLVEAAKATAVRPMRDPSIAVLTRGDSTKEPSALSTRE